MKRKMVIVLSGMTRQQKDEITKVADSRGFEAAFFEHAQQAGDAFTDAEIVLSGAALPDTAAPRLKWLCASSAGVNQFARSDRFLAHKALLSNSSGAYGVTIAEHILMLVLMLLRRQPEYTESCANRLWKRDLPIASLQGSRMVLLGTGDIGRTTAERLRGFAPASLIGVNRSGRNPGNVFDRTVPLHKMDALLSQTDLLICSLPGTAETYHLLNAERLSLLPEGALLVNVGRGSVIDEQALEPMLRCGRLKAALDVFETEPLPKESSLWDCPNLLITPHVAGGLTLPYTRQRIIDLFLEDFENYCAQRPLLRGVDPVKGY